MLGALTVSVAALLGAEDAWHWPVDLSREVTSSFGEFRSRRFHAGIDIRTGGNRPLRAIGDGHISRIRCAPSGYGKAVYLQLNEGPLAVYAHLDGFSEELEAYVRAQQHAARSYTVDLYPQPGQFPITRGEVIATSGQTGTTAPHLHFELRQPEEQPINPYHAGLTWNDTTRPLVQRIVVTPLDPASHVDGDLLPEVREVKHLGNSNYETAPVRAAGRIAIGVEFYDPAPGGSKLGAQTLVLEHADTEQFRLEYDRISYDDIGDGEVAYHPYVDGRFLMLWRWPGSECAIYMHSAADGALTVAPGEASNAVLRIRDVAGNEATVTVPLEHAALQPQHLLALRLPKAPATGTWSTQDNSCC